MAEILWRSDQTERGVRERALWLHVEGRRVPGIVWSRSREEPLTPRPAEAGARAPRDASGPPALVLLGHGGGGHKRQEYGLALARRLARQYGVATLAIDGPVHGERRPPDVPVEDVDTTRRRYARPEVADSMVTDWRAALAAVQAEPDLATARLGYLGLSMGTLFGVPLLAAEPRISVAVLGLMGIREDGGRIAARLAEDAPNVRCRLLFLQQRADELFPLAASRALFDGFGSADKHLLTHDGPHGAVPPDAFVRALRFLARGLGAAADTGQPEPARRGT